MQIFAHDHFVRRDFVSQTNALSLSLANRFAFPVILSSIFFFSAATRSRKPMDFDPVRDASWREVNEESGRFLERVPVSPACFTCRLETHWLGIGRLCRLPKGLCLFARMRSSYDSHDRSISLKNKETFKLFH